MADWASYTIADFIPFTAEVYLRLVERANAAWWPLHAGMVAVALATLVLALRGKPRPAGLLLALLWAWSGYGFLHQFYTPLNWAGLWFAGAFYAQALLVATLPAADPAGKIPALRHWPGLALCLAGLGWSLITLAGRNGPAQTEVVGIHPDPTALFSLGLLLLIARGRWLPVLLAIPLLWCLIAGATLLVLALAGAPLLFAAVAFTLAIGLADALTRLSRMR